MKIYLLALLGLAAGGAVKTSPSSTYDYTVAASPDSSAPAATSDTSHTTDSPRGSTISIISTTPSSTSPTSSPSSIGSIDSTNSSTSSPTAPAGDDIRDIGVTMTFAAEAIDDVSDKELLSSIEKSVVATLDGSLGTDVTMSKIAVVEIAPAGRRLTEDPETSATKQLEVTYTVHVKQSVAAGAKHTIQNDHAKFSDALTKAGITNSGVTSVTDNVQKTICPDTLPTPENGKLNCDMKMTGGANRCTLNCNTGYVVEQNTGLKCVLGSTNSEWKGFYGKCVADPCKSAVTDDTLCKKGNFYGKCNTSTKECVVDTTLCDSTKIKDDECISGSNKKGLCTEKKRILCC